MRAVVPSIEEAGGRVVVVLAQDRATVARWLEDHPFPAPVVVDDDRTIAKTWGVYHRLGIDAIRIARPASFLVDGTGTVRSAFVASHQFESAGLETILASFDALRSGARRQE